MFRFTSFLYLLFSLCSVSQGQLNHWYRKMPHHEWWRCLIVLMVYFPPHGSDARLLHTLVPLVSPTKSLHLSTTSFYSRPGSIRCFFFGGEEWGGVQMQPFFDVASPSLMVCCTSAQEAFFVQTHELFAHWLFLVVDFFPWYARLSGLVQFLIGVVWS